MSHVFISYSKKNKEYADKLVNFLRDAGFDVWIDGELEPSDEWWEKIVHAINGCGAFIVIMTPESEESRWVKREIYQAEGDKTIFPLLLSGNPDLRKSKIWSLFAPIHYEDVRGDKLPQSKFLDKLASHIPRKEQRGENIVPEPKQTIPLPTSKPAAPTALQIAPEIQRLLDTISNPNIEPPERAEAGRKLAELGDPRPGVGLDINRLPNIDWVEIPGGEFLYGSDKAKDPLAEDDELPRRKIDLPTFYIARYPITYAQYEAFVNSDGYTNGTYWTPDGLRLRRHERNPEVCWQDKYWHISNHPIVGITFFEAMAFCKWLNIYSHLNPTPGEGRVTIRLPTEQEWEKAARGTNGHIYPWGNKYISGYANINEATTPLKKYW